ncbi:hypothetical protein Cri9333_0347 [Crinalium epipsammum PCC 9333]|uniref:Uncharacterized protein n=1 Tax=Crinalium epipsammum PCC 9333 TaxID=1173022 RepID=K9VTC9_9CYAN|nr:hypothetical protein [Crinalium epipsammum]AFZ11328.1 hypothetical protein Cri9333_0347 [Crinalium epipsammum PCC 9333]
MMSQLLEKPITPACTEEAPAERAICLRQRFAIALSHRQIIAQVLSWDLSREVHPDEIEAIQIKNDIVWVNLTRDRAVPIAVETFRNIYEQQTTEEITEEPQPLKLVKSNNVVPWISLVKSLNTTKMNSEDTPEMHFKHLPEEDTPEIEMELLSHSYRCPALNIEPPLRETLQEQLKAISQILSANYVEREAERYPPNFICVLPDNSNTIANIPVLNLDNNNIEL